MTRDDEPQGPSRDVASTPDSQAAAGHIGAILDASAEVVDQAVDELSHMDAIVGDGDHGIAMHLGVHAARDAAREAIDRGAGAKTTLDAAATAWSGAASGASAEIWPRLLRALGSELGDTEPVTAPAVARGAVAAKSAVIDFGSAKPGDKTVIDAIAPFVDDLQTRIAAGQTLTEAWGHAAGVAEEAAQETSALAAAFGSKAVPGDEAVGMPDPGAVSFALVCQTVYDVLAAIRRDRPSDSSLA